MVAQTLRNYLLQQGITATTYIGFLPAAPDTAIVLTPTPGFPPNAKHNYDTTGLQVRTRSLDYTTAEDLIEDIFDKVQSLSTVVISGIHFVDIQAQQDPFSLGKDEQDRYQFAQNYIIEYYNDIGRRV